MEKSRKYTDSPKTPRTSPTLEQNFQAEDANWLGAMSPTVGKNHDQEEFTSPTSGKKSVLTKVKEKAKKLRYSLSGKKKHFHESSISSDGSSHGNSTPSWGVTLEDDKLDDIDNRDDPNEQFEDPEYLGAPMYESEAAPEVFKETAKQHPRDVQLEHVVAEKHVLPDTESKKDDPIQENIQETDKSEHVTSNKTVTESVKPEPVASNTTVTETDKPEPVASNKTVTETDKPEPVASNKTITESVTEKLVAPAYAAVSGATHIASKIASMTLTSPGAQETAKAPSQTSDEAPETVLNAAQIAISPCGSNANKETDENLGNVKQSTTPISPKEWDKGISVKEYFMNAREPKDDDQALSEAITDAISPKKSTSGSPGVVEKVKGAVTSFFWYEESSKSTGNDESASPAAPSLSNKNLDENTSPAAPALTNKNLNVSSPTHLPRARSSELPRSAGTNSRSTTFTASPAAHAAVEEENHGKMLQTN